MIWSGLIKLAKKTQDKIKVSQLSDQYQLKTSISLGRINSRSSKSSSYSWHHCRWFLVSSKLLLRRNQSERYTESKKWNNSQRLCLLGMQ